MTLRFSIIDATAHAVAMWFAGGGLCCCCARELAAPGMPVPNKGAAVTIEHVLPKSPRPRDLAKIAAFRALVGGGGRKAMAHWLCNHRKGNRAPTGCEVVFLMAVNARLGRSGADDSRWGPTSNIRTKARKVRRMRSKRLRAMQAAMS
jgi:hypothetical protein